MPLVLFCGIPSSGKTKRALELRKYLEDKYKCNVVLINEENLNIKKNESYKDNTSEKMVRSFLRSNVEKNLNEQTVVILDSMNYIKGYRYELFCQARSAKTPHCVVYMDLSVEKAREYNKTHENGLNPELFEDYAGRIEIPNPKNIWDSPLFQVRDYEPTPCEEIAQVILFEEKKSKDPVSTKQEVVTKPNFLYELDKRAQDIIDVISEKQGSMYIQGMMIKFEGCKKKLQLENIVSLIELKKYKKEFISVCKQNPLKNENDIGDAFITYLETVLQRNN